MKTFLAVIFTALLVGCGVMPLRPGRSEFASQSGISGSVRQSQNPKSETVQKYERTVENGKTTEKVETKIGAAQKDVAREIGAKLSSLRPVMYIGILIFLFGAASFVYPPLKLAVGGSATTSAVITLAGGAMIVLPTLIVGNEILILAVASGAAFFWFVAHRHGKLQGLVDANKNGIDDRNEKL